VRRFYTFILIASAIFLTACKTTSPNVANSMARFDSSEVNSQPFKFKLAGTSDKIHIISDESQPSDDIKEATGELGYSVAMTLGHGVELKYSQTNDIAQKYGLKYQFYGAPLEEKVVGNVSLATDIKYVTSDRWKNLDSGNRWELEQKYLDLALIGGYRIGPQALLYGSVFYQKGDVDGQYELREYVDPDTDIKLNEGCGIEIDCITSQFDDDGYGYGVNLAFEYEVWSWFAITGELVYHNANWFNRSQSETASNVSLEFRF
jgi:hypothetical protein